MINKPTLRLFLQFTTALMFIAIFACLDTAPVLADCGSGPQYSSCEKCHQPQINTISQNLLHTLHAGKNSCIDCHGGNQTSIEKTQAHLGVFGNPLTDTFTNCHACHPNDYSQRARMFDTVSGSSAPTTQAPSNKQNVISKMTGSEILLINESGLAPHTELDLTTSLILAGGAVIIMVLTVFGCFSAFKI